MRLISQKGLRYTDVKYEDGIITIDGFEVNQKQLDEAVYKIKLNTIDCILIMSCMVLRDEFDFGQKRLERFCERFNLKTDALCDEEIIWDDLIQTLKEETGLDFTIRENK